LVASLKEHFVSRSGPSLNTTIIRNGPSQVTPQLLPLSINSRLPTNKDYPLWRVSCKVTPIYFIFHTSHIYHLSSLVWKKRLFIFPTAEGFPTARDTMCLFKWLCKGWVYLEATLNKHLRSLLRLTPGVICDCCGEVSEHIPFVEGCTDALLHQ